MNPTTTTVKCAMALVIAGVLAASPVMADNSDKGGKGNKGGKNERVDRRDDQRSERGDDDRSRRDTPGRSDGKRGHFEDRQHAIVRDYYVEQFRGARCPPGLAKKQNGCMPPGQAKKWQLGRPLARDVIYYEVPQPLVVQIGLPPAGHRYVRVAGDILLIALGTGMVVDAIQDLGR